jgi:hypothetical protein
LQLREQTVNGTFKDFGHRPIVVIRFNLMRKQNEHWNGDRVLGNWWKSTLKKSKLNEWAERLECLRLQIEYWIEHRTTDKTVEVIQLFDTNRNSSRIILKPQNGFIVSTHLYIKKLYVRH